MGERFGPTLTTEHLESEDNLKVDAETLRRSMLAEGLWSRERKRRRHRQRRARKEHFGELVQMDGSFHAWLEERGPEGCLIDMVDDASNTTWAQLGEQETIWAAADALRAWMERYGVPLALYVDWKNLYKRPATPGERMRGGRADHAVWAHVQEFGDRADRRQFAASERARGAGAWDTSGSLGEETAAEGDRQPRSRERVFAERVSGGTQPALCACRGEQGRLSPARAARNGTGPDFAAGDGAYGERGLGGALRQSFFQLEPQSQSYAPTRSKVLVCEGRYGGLAIEYRGRPLRWREIVAPAKPQDLDTPVRKALPHMPISVKKRKWTPPANHPWHQAVRREVQTCLQVGRHRAAHDAGLALRFALNAPPCGLRRAALRTRPAKQRDAVGRARWESSFLELPGAELFRGKTPRKEKEAEQKKGTF